MLGRFIDMQILGKKPQEKIPEVVDSGITQGKIIFCLFVFLSQFGSPVLTG